MTVRSKIFAPVAAIALVAGMATNVVAADADPEARGKVMTDAELGAAPSAAHFSSGPLWSVHLSDL